MGAKKNCAEEIRADMEALNYDAVSYTHLDVYKRQSLLFCSESRLRYWSYISQKN